MSKPLDFITVAIKQVADILSAYPVVDLPQIHTVNNQIKAALPEITLQIHDRDQSNVYVTIRNSFDTAIPPARVELPLTLNTFKRHLPRLLIVLTTTDSVIGAGVALRPDVILQRKAFRLLLGDQLGALRLKLRTLLHTHVDLAAENELTLPPSDNNTSTSTMLALDEEIYNLACCSYRLARHLEAGERDKEPTINRLLPMSHSVEIYSAYECIDQARAVFRQNISELFSIINGDAGWRFANESLAIITIRKYINLIELVALNIKQLDTD